MLPLMWCRPRRPVQSLSTTCTTLGRVGSTLRVRHSSPSVSSAVAEAAADGSLDEMLGTPVVPMLVARAAALVATFSSAKSDEGAEPQAAEAAANAKQARDVRDVERVILGCSPKGVCSSPLVAPLSFTVVLDHFERGPAPPRSSRIFF